MHTGVECDYFTAHDWFEKAASNWGWDPSDETTLVAARTELHKVRKMVLRMINSQSADKSESAAHPSTTNKQQV